MTKEALRLALEALVNTDSEPSSKSWKREIEAITAIKKALAQQDYKSTFDHQLMENAQGELERVKLVQTGVGIEQRAEEAYEAAKQRSWVGVSDEVAQPEQEPVAYVKTVIEALYENSDPVSVEAAELLERITTSPQRKPLTDEEIERNWQFLYDEEGNPPDRHDFARAIEAEHGIKG